MIDKKTLEYTLDYLPQFEKAQGLIPAVMQDAVTGEVLMLGYVNQEAVDETFSTGLATFWTRTRQKLWTKGLTSGNSFSVEEILMDCDQDTLLYKVRPNNGGSCDSETEAGEKRRTCFYRDVVRDESAEGKYKLEYREGMR